MCMSNAYKPALNIYRVNRKYDLIGYYISDRDYAFVSFQIIYCILFRIEKIWRHNILKTCKSMRVSNSVFKRNSISYSHIYLTRKKHFSFISFLLCLILLVCMYTYMHCATFLIRMLDVDFCMCLCECLDCLCLCLCSESVCISLSVLSIQLVIPWKSGAIFEQRVHIVVTFASWMFISICCALEFQTIIINRTFSLKFINEWS